MQHELKKVIESALVYQDQDTQFVIEQSLLPEKSLIGQPPYLVICSHHHRSYTMGSYCLRLRRILAALSIWFAVCQVHVMNIAATDSICQNLQASPVLTPFVDELPIPSTIHLSTRRISIGAWKIQQKLHRDLPPTTLYAFGQSQATATFPGPTLEARRDIPARIHWENHIPDREHFLPVDRTLHWANPKHGGVPIVVHLHGGETQSTFDGHPEAWFTPEQKDTGPAFTTQMYEYPNQQRPTTLWYHDHTVGITRLNVMAGLVGFYFLRSAQEERLTKLFAGGLEIPFVIKDLQFWANGSINFPSVGNSPGVHPVWCPEYFGDTVVVNGKVLPFMNAVPRVYRFRMLNGANARFFNLTMNNGKPGKPALNFTKIGTDGGLLPTSQVVSSLLFGPAERLDVIIDFTSLKAGDVIFFNNLAVAPFPGSNAVTNSTPVMKIQIVADSPEVEAGHEKLITSLEDVLEAFSDSVVPIPPISFGTALHRHLLLQELDDAQGNPIFITLGNRTWEDPVTELPREGAVEVWEMINTTPDAHPMHLHLVQFVVLDQQPFNVTEFNSGSCNITISYGKPRSCFTGPVEPPLIFQTGQKDTTIVFPGKVTRYGVRFLTADGQPFPFDPTVGPGYVWHCHILDHEDNDMMRPYKVIH